MAKLTLSPPWVIFYREVQALFELDPEVHVVYDEDAEIIKLYVDNTAKADMLSRLLPGKKTFGRVSVDLRVIPADGSELGTELPEDITDDTFNVAFEDNGAFSYAKTFTNLIFPGNATYVVMANEVVQFYADDISDINGLKSTLYENICRDVFADVPVNFCTDLPSAED